MWRTITRLTCSRVMQNSNGNISSTVSPVVCHTIWTAHFRRFLRILRMRRTWTCCPQIFTEHLASAIILFEGKSRTFPWVETVRWRSLLETKISNTSLDVMCLLNTKNRPVFKKLTVSKCSFLTLIYIQTVYFFSYC